MDKWWVVRSRAITPPSGRKFDAAYVVHLSRGEGTAEMIVEFEAPSAVASGGYAEEVSRRFDRDDVLPQHVVLERGGISRVVEGPPETVAGVPPGAGPWSERVPGRARNRRRG